jgi:hypothetical protein
LTSELGLWFDTADGGWQELMENKAKGSSTLQSNTKCNFPSLRINTRNRNSMS